MRKFTKAGSIFILSWLKAKLVSACFNNNYGNRNKFRNIPYFCFWWIYAGSIISVLFNVLPIP